MLAGCSQSQFLFCYFTVCALTERRDGRPMNQHQPSKVRREKEGKKEHTHTRTHWETGTSECQTESDRRAVNTHGIASLKTILLFFVVFPIRQYQFRPQFFVLFSCCCCPACGTSFYFPRTMRVLLGIFFSPLFFFICDIVSRLSTSARSHRGELISAIILSATRMIVRCVRWPSVSLSVVVN